jgi:hypothetical protein
MNDVYPSFQYSKEREQYMESEGDIGLEDEVNEDDEEESVDDDMNDKGGSQASCAGVMSPEKAGEFGSPHLERFPTSSTPYQVSLYPHVCPTA